MIIRKYLPAIFVAASISGVSHAATISTGVRVTGDHLELVFGSPSTTRRTKKVDDNRSLVVASDGVNGEGYPTARLHTNDLINGDMEDYYYDYSGNWKESIEEQSVYGYLQPPSPVVISKSDGSARVDLTSGSLGVEASSSTGAYFVHGGETAHYISTVRRARAGSSFYENIFRDNSDIFNTVTLDLNLDGRLYSYGHRGDAKVHWKVGLGNGYKTVFYDFIEEVSQGESFDLGTLPLDSISLDLPVGIDQFWIYSTLSVETNSYLDYNYVANPYPTTTSGAEFGSTAWMNMTFANDETFTSSSGTFLSAPRANIANGEVPSPGSILLVGLGLAGILTSKRGVTKLPVLFQTSNPS